MSVRSHKFLVNWYLAAVLVRGSWFGVCTDAAKLSLTLDIYVPTDFSGHHVLLM